MTSCLVIDCSGQVISVALARDGAGAGIWSETLEQKHGQAEALAPLAERVFQRSSLNDWTELEHVVVCRGPGGFTTTHRGRLCSGSPVPRTSSFGVWPMLLVVQLPPSCQRSSADLCRIRAETIFIERPTRLKPTGDRSFC